jgi:Fur family peroxide stress response transcriptional regulator
MKPGGQATKDRKLNEQLATSGFRFTPQRQHVYNVLVERRDHPTAEEVFIRAKHDMPDISIATVYNCLDALVKSRVVRQVNLERAATRYCPNMREHCHFYCETCGGIFDIDPPPKGRAAEFSLPRGYRLEHLEISVRGACPKCAVNPKG